jgi:hypothetical protein
MGTRATESRKRWRYELPGIIFTIGILHTTGKEMRRSLSFQIRTTVDLGVGSQTKFRVCFSTAKLAMGGKILENTVQQMLLSQMIKNVGIVEARIIFWEVAPNKRISQILQLKRCNSTTRRGSMMKRRLSRKFFKKVANKSEQKITTLTDTKLHLPTFKSVIYPKVKFQMKTMKLKIGKQWNSF